MSSIEQAPYRALVLVRNLDIPGDGIDLGEFVIKRVGLRFREVSKTLDSEDVYQGDWLLEKTYPELPTYSGPDPPRLGRIPFDIEDILFMLRLFKAGEIAFVKQAIVKPDGETLRQYPYRIVNNLNSDSPFPTEIGDADRELWSGFANDLRCGQSWDAPWFLLAKRFFLYGGAKGFNPGLGEVDRMVDYATALEATLVPETDFSRNRCANRAAQLCSSDPAEQEAISKLVKKIYDIRSSIVHGSILGEENRKWLQENRREVEHWVRQVLVAAVKKLPQNETSRTAFLKTLADVDDAKRGEYAVEKFREIQTEDVRNTTADRIAGLASVKRRRT